MTTPLEIPRDTVDYLRFTLADATGQDLSADTVQLALSPVGSDDPRTWLACTHLTGTSWRTTAPITWSRTNYPNTSYFASAKVADASTAPVVYLGRITITKP